MIEMNCPSCNQHITFPDDAAGKRAKCRKCGEAFAVPNSRAGHSQVHEEDKIEDAQTQSSVEPASVPFWVWVGLGVFLIALGTFCLYYVRHRDTWERDHYAEVKALADAASNAVYAGRITQGLDTYDRLFQLVGPRVLKGATKDIMESAKALYQREQEEYEDNITSLLSRSLANIQSSVNNKAYPATSTSVATLNKVRDSLDQLISMATVRSPHGNKLIALVAEARQSKRVIQDRVTKLTQQMREEQKLDTQQYRSLLTSLEPFTREVKKISNAVNVGINHQDYAREVRDLVARFNDIPEPVANKPNRDDWSEKEKAASDAYIMARNLTESHQNALHGWTSQINYNSSYEDEIKRCWALADDAARHFDEDYKKLQSLCAGMP